MFKTAYRQERINFIKALLGVALPITLQNFIASAVNSADVFMLGYVGQKELSAVSLANQFTFVVWGFFFGIGSALSILFSQYWGKGDKKAVVSVMGIGLKISGLFVFAIVIPLLLFPRQMMLIYTSEEQLIDIAAGYLQIVAISYLCMIVTQVYHCVLRTTDRAMASTVISFFALGSNMVLNACFIWGLAGFPVLGVTGVAIGTLISRVLELILILYLAATNKALPVSCKELYHFNKVLFFDFVRFGSPALINDIVWTLAFTIQSVIMGHMNADVVAANAVVCSIRELATIACFAVATSSTVILGHHLGEGKTDLAWRDSKRFNYVTLVLSVVTGILLFFIGPMVGMYFSLSERAIDYMRFMMMISTYYIVGQAMNTLWIAGIFRAGGDTRFGMICDAIVMWLIVVPTGLISAFVLKLPPMVVYFIICLDEFWKMPVAFRYYLKRRWLKNITRDNVA